MEIGEKIKNALDLVSFIGREVKLKKRGQNWVGLCPFHQEKTPSFTVSPLRQMWYCFGCQRGGDIFSYLMEKEKLSFSQALRILAREAGIELPRRLSPVPHGEKERLTRLLEEAQRFFRYFLRRDQRGAKARHYLKKRKIEEKIAKQFELGYAPPFWRAVSRYLLQRGFTLVEMEKAGLVIRRGQGQWYDRFRDRIIFPLRNQWGQLIGFSGRALEKNVAAKYLNSPETILFQKRRFLYGLYQARSALKEKKKIILVEGLFDVLTAHQQGWPLIVAPLGTALTAEQVQLLQRQVEIVYLAFDQDEAGQRARERALPLLEAAGLKSRVLHWSGAQDLDELLRSRPQELKKVLAGAVDGFTYLLQEGARRFDLQQPAGQLALLKFVLPFYQAAPSELARQNYCQQLADFLAVEEEALKADLSRLSSAPSPLAGPEERKKEDFVLLQRSRQEVVTDYLLQLMLQAPSWLWSLAEWQKTVLELEEKFWPRQKQKQIYQLLQQIVAAAKEVSLEKVLAQLPPAARSLAQRLALSLLDLKTPDDFLAEAQRAVEEAKKLFYQKELQHLIAQLKRAEAENSLAPEELSRLQKKIQQLTTFLARWKKSPPSS